MVVCLSICEERQVFSFSGHLLKVAVGRRRCQTLANTKRGAFKTPPKAVTTPPSVPGVPSFRTLESSKPTGKLIPSLASQNHIKSECLGFFQERQENVWDRHSFGVYKKASLLCQGPILGTQSPGHVVARGGGGAGAGCRALSPTLVLLSSQLPQGLSLRIAARTQLLCSLGRGSLISWLIWGSF